MIETSPLSEYILTSTSFGPMDSKLGVLHTISFSELKVACESWYYFPRLNLTKKVMVDFSPSPLTWHLVFPVSGPIFGVISYIVYSGPVMIDMLIWSKSFRMSLFQPPWTINLWFTWS